MLLIYVITGLLSGLIAGILGIGGGIIVVPALLYGFEVGHVVLDTQAMHMAAGSSLAIMVFTALASFHGHYQKGMIQWSLYRQLMPGIALGTILGGIGANHLSTAHLKIAFALFLFYVAYRMSLKHTPDERVVIKASLWQKASAVIMGGLSGMLGIGGGTLVITYLSARGVMLRVAMAVASSVTLTVAIIGTVTFMMVGFNEPALPAWSTGYIYWPAVLAVAALSTVSARFGSHIAYRLPIKLLQGFFVAMILITAVHMLYSGLSYHLFSMPRGVDIAN